MRMDSQKRMEPSSLKQKESDWIVKAFFISLVAGTLLAMVGATGIYWYFSRNLPKIITVADYHPLGVTQVFGTGGKGEAEIGEFFKERRYLIPYDKIPDSIVKAFVSAEDDRFFEHPGVNVFSIIRAGIANFKAGRVVQGGSTITQQVAKSLLLISEQREKSLDRKIKELILANRIEKNLTKQQILYLYLNQIYLGHGAYGVQSASRTYFGKDISEITLAESALLAGMPQAPGKYSPLLSPKKAKERQLYVLRRMVDNKYITQAQMKEAAAQSLKIFHGDDLNNRFAPYYVEHIRKYLVEKYGEKAVYEEGLTVTVPTNAELSLAAKKAVRDGLLAIDKRNGYRGPIKFLNNTKEIENFLKESRIALIENRLHFKLFLPDGRLDSIEAMHFAGMQSDAELLEPDQMYQAVVTSFDNRNKTAHVMIGAIQGELSIDQMRWAKAPRNDKNPQTPRFEPSLPSNVFKKGDVIWVSLAGSGSDLEPNGPVKVALEQEPVVQGSLLSIDVKTGSVLAMVGGYDFDKSEFNRATQAIRQVGSAFKPIIYSSALEKGFTPASVILDSPIVFRDSDGIGSWKPSNFEEKFYGDTIFRQALIKSRNIPTIKILQAVQVPYVIEYAKRLGMNVQLNADLSIALGSASMSLIDLTRTYALFPRLGKKVTPIFISKVMSREGQVLEEADLRPLSLEKQIPVSSKSDIDTDTNTNTKVSGSIDQAQNQVQPVSSKVVFPTYPLPDDPSQVLDPRIAFVMTHLMKEVVTFGTGHGAQNLGRMSAGKTGTTNDYLDAWFMGFTPQVVTGVWVGFDNQKSIGPLETGARAALPIWLSFMKEAIKSYPEADFIVPPGVVFASIDATSGKLASPNSSTAIKEAFVEGTQPTETVGTGPMKSESQSDFFKEDQE